MGLYRTVVVVAVVVSGDADDVYILPELCYTHVAWFGKRVCIYV